MIDQALLLTMILMALAVSLSRRLWPPIREENRDPLGVGLPALAVGMLAGRLAAMALDDPSGITRLRDVLLIRGGAEFWPGVAAGLVTLVAMARRERLSAWGRLADLAPQALVAYAVFEATCIVRDGCFGPDAPFGLRPEGVQARQLPVGLLVGVAAMALARVASRMSPDPPRVLLVAIGGLAALRTAAAFGLPHLGSGPTRQHVESVVVLGVAAAAGVTGALIRRRRIISDSP